MASLKQKLESAAVELSHAKRKLDECQRHFDELYKQATGGSKVGKTAKERAKEMSEEKVVEAAAGAGTFKNCVERNGRVIDRIERFVVDNVEEQHHYQEIAKAVRTTPDTVRALLYKLKNSGRVERMGRGFWRAIVTAPTNGKESKQEANNQKF